jgi:rod shape-determining protein MreC
MPVVAGAGLVGRVVDASQSGATILLITDAQSSIGVTLSGSGDRGVGKGRGADRPLDVDLVESATLVAKDEVVVTSGLQQSVFPAGIPIGRVLEAKPEPGGLQQQVTVRPVVDMRRLTFVKVLMWSPKP